jgi:alkanesulfonate monooxygenase SsuD/methylene tetrahydromethanopterin reductase-like flavin-dependent oxidoreductase (luciferase family)
MTITAGARFGLVLFTESFGADVASPDVLGWALDYVREAERSGWHDVWTTEHHFTPHAQNPSALTMAAFLGGRSHLHTGTAVCVLPNHHPVALAEQTALLQHLTGGRFTLGVGRGQPLVDLEILGTGMAGYRDMSDGLADLDRALRTGTVPVRSRDPRFDGLSVVPTPPANRAPFVVSAASSGTVRLAARHGLPVLLGPFIPLDVKRSLLDEHADVAATFGHETDPQLNIDSAYFAVDDDGSAAKEIVRQGLADFMARVARDARPLVERPAPTGGQARAAAEALDDCHVAGTPTECADQLAKRIEVLGVGRVLLMPEAASPEVTLRTIRRAGEEVFGRAAGTTTAGVTAAATS